MSRELLEIPTTVGRHGLKVPTFETFLDKKTQLATGRSFRFWAEALIDANDPLPRDSYHRTGAYDKQIVVPADDQHPLTIIHGTYIGDYQPAQVMRDTYVSESDWEDVHGLSRGKGRTPLGHVNEFIIAVPPIELGRSMSTFVLARYEYSADPNFGGHEYLNFKGERVETDASRAHFQQHGYVEGWHGETYETISPEILKVAAATMELLGTSL